MEQLGIIYLIQPAEPTIYLRKYSTMLRHD